MGAGDQLKSRHSENGVNDAFGGRGKRGASGASAHMLMLGRAVHGKTRGDSGGKSRVGNCDLASAAQLETMYMP